MNASLHSGQPVLAAGESIYRARAAMLMIHGVAREPRISCLWPINSRNPALPILRHRPQAYLVSQSFSGSTGRK